MHLANKEKALLPFLSSCLGCIQTPEAIFEMRLGLLDYSCGVVSFTVHWVTIS